MDDQGRLNISNTSLFYAIKTTKILRIILIIYITINIKSKHFNPDICRVDSLFSDGLKSKLQKNKENIFRFKNQPMSPFKQTIKPSCHILD